MNFLIQASYFIAAVLFIFGLKQMSSPVTARRGVIWAGVGMVLATLATFFIPGLHNFGLMILAIVIGAAAAWWSAKKVAMTDMPQMVAIYNGMGGGAAAAIAAIELAKVGADHHGVALVLGVIGALIGSVAFSGSVIAFAKLQGLINKSFVFKGQNVFNLAVLGVAVLLGLLMMFGSTTPGVIIAFFLLALAFGVLMTLPIGGADMPVVISLYNALTGLAVAFEGYVLGNPAMIIAGTVVGAAGSLLTQLMAKAMNRPLSNVLFSAFGQGGGEAAGAIEGTMKETAPSDAAITMAYADSVIIVPGYGLAVAQAQHKIWEFCELLEERGVDVKFAIHPVAGRMPGHMNVLLAEAGVPYDKIFDLDEINSDFPQTNVTLVIGANDVVNPVARSNPESPIYGMPILDADKSEQVYVVKRGRGAGFSGIDNELFYLDNTQMIYGDAQEVANKLIQGIKSLG